METNPSQNLIKREIDLFVSHIDSLMTTLPLTMFVIQDVGKKFFDSLQEFENSNCTLQEIDEEKKILVPTEHYKSWVNLKKKNGSFNLAKKLIPRSFLVSLVSQYDAFLGGLLRSIYKSKPERLNPSEKSIPFREIIQFPSIDSIKEYIIEKEVEKTLRQSHFEQLKSLENEFEITLTKDPKILKKFIELTERRNLFVHNDGTVSSQYLRVCQNLGIEIKDDLKEGVRLGVSKQYFQDSYQCVFELGVKLAHVLWRKLLPNEREVADANLNNLAYELIDRENYDLAIPLLDFSCETIKTFFDEQNKFRFLINRAQAYKWSGNNEKSLKILNEFDWSAKGDDLKLANAVLREDWENATTIMLRIGKSGIIDKTEYKDWPLFKQFRTQQIFLENYEKIFGESFPKVITSESQDDENVH